MNLNEKKEDKEQDHDWIEKIDFNESRLSPKQIEKVTALNNFPYNQ